MSEETEELFKVLCLFFPYYKLRKYIQHVYIVFILTLIYLSVFRL